jgi:fructose-1,6-bisphosphatase/sedoheptulose 1,7-bisphosphatase-like protein
VHDDLGPWKRGGEIAHSSGVVEMDMGDDDGREVIGADAERVEGVHNLPRGSRGTGLDEARTLAADEIARGDAVIAAHLGVDEPDLVAEVDRANVLRVHSSILSCVVHSIGAAVVGEGRSWVRE